jgi:hypothetical protein
VKFTLVVNVLLGKPKIPSECIGIKIIKVEIVKIKNIVCTINVL